MHIPAILRNALTAAAVLLTVGLALTACRGADPQPLETTDEATTAEETVYDDPYDDGPSPFRPAVQSYPAVPAPRSEAGGYRFVTDAEKESWTRPLADLLSNVLIPCGEGGELPGHNASADNATPGIPQSYSCGLLDVTADGVPELLVFPLGGGGSSGNAYYQIFDIFTGQEIGDMSGGHADAWCYYYNTETEEAQLYGQYQWRIGWDGRVRFLDQMAILAEDGRYESISYLRTEHYFHHIQRVASDGTIVLEEAYADTKYYFNDERVFMDDFYQEYDHFVETCIRIPETALILFSWDDVSAEEDSDPEKGQKMAYALTHSEQAFLAP